MEKMRKARRKNGRNVGALTVECRRRDMRKNVEANNRRVCAAVLLDLESGHCHRRHLSHEAAGLQFKSGIALVILHLGLLL